MTVRRRRMRRLRVWLAALVVGGTVVLAGCSGAGSGSDEGGGDDAAGQTAADEEARQTEDAAAAGTASGVAGHDGAPRVPVVTRQVISVGKVELRGDDLAEVRSGIDRLLGRYGGYVADERTTTEDGEPARSTLEVRVPSRRFDELMGSFGELATVVSTAREATDVTTEVIDVEARIRTQEVSLDRLRRFLGRSDDIATVIRLESEIARREADLASLRGQQDYLEDATALATVTVTMTRRDADPPEADPLEDAGFVAGLRDGWGALEDVLVVGATVVGAVLPFAVVLLVVGGPVLLWWRLGRRRRAAPEPLV